MKLSMIALTIVGSLWIGSAVAVEATKPNVKLSVANNKTPLATENSLLE